MLLTVDRRIGETAGRRSVMHTLALILAQEGDHLFDPDAGTHRHAGRKPASNRRSRWTGIRAIAGAISGLSRRVTVAADHSVTPNLSDYPYRA
jgi:hypothetical protein